MGYESFIAGLSKECRCCPVCWSHPCDGLLAGGFCDQHECSCDDEPEDPLDYDDD